MSWQKPTPVQLRHQPNGFEAPTLLTFRKGAQNSARAPRRFLSSLTMHCPCFHGWRKTRWNKADFYEFVGLFPPSIFGGGFWRGACPLHLSSSFKVNLLKLHRVDEEWWLVISDHCGLAPCKNWTTARGRNLSQSDTLADFFRRDIFHVTWKC